MKKIVLALSVAGALMASSSAYNYEVTPTLSLVKPEGNLDLSNHLAYGLRLGKNLDGFVLDQIELGFDYSNLVKVKNTNGAKTDITRYYANAVKEFSSAENVTFYGLVGLGYEDLAKEFADNKDSFFGQYGVGLKFNFNDRVALKTEVRHAIKFSNADNNLFASLGLSIGFGEKAPKPALVEEVVFEKIEKIEVVENIDDDKDGIPNHLDKCHNTKEGVVVDTDGCDKIIRLHIQFAFDKAVITDSYKEKINEVADFLKKNESYKVILEGHADSTGTEAYNLKLSEKRAAAVAEELERLGINAEKIEQVAYGETKPIASNKTKEGRAENRRVDSKFKY